MNMKAATYINMIKTSGVCSIMTAEHLTNAMHREGLLHCDLSVRLRPLFGDFDIIPTTWLHGDHSRNIKPYYLGTTDDAAELIEMARKASILYSANREDVH